MIPFGAITTFILRSSSVVFDDVINCVGLLTSELCIGVIDSRLATCLLLLRDKRFFVSPHLRELLSIASVRAILDLRVFAARTTPP